MYPVFTTKQQKPAAARPLASATHRRARRRNFFNSSKNAPRFLEAFLWSDRVLFFRIVSHIKTDVNYDKTDVNDDCRKLFYNREDPLNLSARVVL